MNQAQEKLKILLLRKRAGEGSTPEMAASWARLGKALKTFTDFEELEIPEGTPLEPAAYLADRDHLFLDSDLADWPALELAPIERLTLVRPFTFAWDDLETRTRTLPVYARHPCLVLEGLGASDLVRLLHLFLMPKRLAGVAPIMEKGSLIVGEKLMDTYQIGSLLDRLCAHLDSTDSFELKARIPDLRQVLSAIVLEGLRSAVAANMTYPFVEFQASASSKKLGVNIRFPQAELTLEHLVRHALSGGDLFWHQIWQCCDAIVLTEHQQHKEIEVMLVIAKAERGNRPHFNTLLFKGVERSALRENLLEAPETYQFKVLSEIHPRESAELQIITADNDLDGIDLAGLPEKVTQQLQSLEEKCRDLTEKLIRKDSQLQDSIRQSQALNQEVGHKRAELLRAMKTLEVQAEASEKKIHELEERLLRARAAAAESSTSKDTHIPTGQAEMLAKLEATLRASESEKAALRENVAHEQKRVSIFEQKYSALYRDISLKDREINELKTAFHKLRKEQTSKLAAASGTADSAASPADKMKDLELKEIAQRQEIRKLTFKLENQEKYLKAQQAEATEKLTMLDQKLKAAKAKELELLKKVEDLMAALKRAHKVA